MPGRYGSAARRFFHAMGRRMKVWAGIAVGLALCAIFAALLLSRRERDRRREREWWR